MDKIRVTGAPQRSMSPVLEVLIIVPAGASQAQILPASR
jgi:hypothetical protein